MARILSVSSGLQAAPARTGQPQRNPVVRLIDTLLTWQERANGRHHLRSLDGYLLRDMGISRLEAEREAMKPFWRA